MGCPLRLDVSDVSTPSDWTPVGADTVAAVQTFDRDTSYVVSTGANSQWFELDDVPGGQDTTTTIHSIKVTACFKSDDPTNPGGLRIDLRSGSVTVGANPHVSRCDYFCVTETFDLNPDTITDWVWGDINGVEIGVTSLGPGETRVTRLYADVICGNLWKPCPRCCCCCSCFSPTVTWSGIVFGDGFTPEVGTIQFNLPYQSVGLDGGCWHYLLDDVHELPILLGSATYGEGGECKLYLNGASLESGVTSLPSCTHVEIQLLRVCDGTDSTTLNIAADTELLCCSPHHLSITTDSISSSGTCGTYPLDCGTMKVECLDMIGDVSIGTDCQPLE